MGTIDSGTEEEACAEVRPWIASARAGSKATCRPALVHIPLSPAPALPGWLARHARLPAADRRKPSTFLLAPVMWWAGGVVRLRRARPARGGLGRLLDDLPDQPGRRQRDDDLSQPLGRDRCHGSRSARFRLLNPLYWVLHSIAAWRALIQLIHKPFYWEKTPPRPEAGAADRPAWRRLEAGAIAAQGGTGLKPWYAVQAKPWCVIVQHKRIRISAQKEMQKWLRAQMCAFAGDPRSAEASQPQAGAQHPRPLGRADPRRRGRPDIGGARGGDEARDGRSPAGRVLSC